MPSFGSLGTTTSTTTQPNRPLSPAAAHAGPVLCMRGVRSGGDQHAKFPSEFFAASFFSLF